MALLDNKQVGEMRDIIARSLSKEEFEQLLQIELGIDLYGDVANKDSSLSVAAYELVRYCERSDRTAELLKALIAARPRNALLRTLIAQLPIEQPAPTSRPNTAGLAEKFGEGILQLPAAVGPAPSPKLLFALGRLLERLQFCSDQLRWLSQYKGLHEALHNLQEKLEVIGPATRDFARAHAGVAIGEMPDDALARDFLENYFFDLQRLVAEARRRLSVDGDDSGAPILSMNEELKWVNVFERIVTEYGQSLANDNALGLSSAFEQLRALLRTSHDLNQHLLEVSRMLSLPKLGKDLQTTLGSIPSGAAGAAEFSMGVHALNQLGPNLWGLVEEHDDWQQLEQLFALAETHGTRGAYFDDWNVVKGSLTSLCMINSGDPSAQLLLTATNDFGAGVPTGSFGYLRRAFRRMFHDVDQRLLDLTEELASQARKLSSATHELAERLSA